MRSLPSDIAFAIAWACALSPAATYHLDCASGDDGRSGLAAETAWKSLSKAAGASLQPGDSLLLKRGCAWTGPLKPAWSGSAAAAIVVGAYGAGPEPAIRNGNPVNVEIAGHHLVLENLAVRSDPASRDAGCEDQPVGYRAGFVFTASAFSNTLQGVISEGHAMGVFLAAGSRRNRILRSRIADNASLSVNDRANPDNDAGAFGILVNGDSNEIAYNDFEANLAWCSYDYGIDGSSVEIYNGRGNRVHHNRSLGEGTFTELGGSRAADNVFAWNLVVSHVEACIFLNVRGAAGRWGPNLDTRAFNNTVYLTGARSQGVVCTEGCSPQILEIRNNIFWAAWKGIYVDAQPAESHNLFWKAGGNPLIQNLRTDSTTRIADPLFADAAAGDFRLRPGSPALDRGHAGIAGQFTLDLGGIAVPSGKGPEIGAFEASTGTGTRQRSRAPAGSGRAAASPSGWAFEAGGPSHPALRNLAGRLIGRGPADGGR